MSTKAVLAQLLAVGVPVGNEVTNNGIITALDFESMVMFGYTYGAIFKILALFSVVLIIIINLYKLGSSIATFIKKVKQNKKRKRVTFKVSRRVKRGIIKKEIATPIQ